MQYFKVEDDADRWVMYDPDANSSMVISKKEIDEQIKEAEARLKEIPDMPDDKTLLEWAKENYPMMDYSTEKTALEKIIADNTAILEELK
jgi:hypothetical protein